MVCVTLRMHNETTPSLLAWTSLLSISTRFDMQRVRSRAIMEIDTFYPAIDPVDKVVLAVKHNVPKWLPLAYAALCQRADPIEIEEGQKLGLETTVLLAKARERVRNSPNLRHLPTESFVPISSGGLNRKEAEPSWMPQECYPARADTPIEIPVCPPSWTSKPEEYYGNSIKCCTPEKYSVEAISVKHSPLSSPGIVQPVPLPVVDVGVAVTDVSLVRRVIDEIFWPASVPPGAPRVKAAKKGKKNRKN